VQGPRRGGRAALSHAAIPYPDPPAGARRGRQPASAGSSGGTWRLMLDTVAPLRCAGDVRSAYGIYLSYVGEWAAL